MSKFDLTPIQDPNFIRISEGAENCYLIGKARIIIIVFGKLNLQNNKGSDGHYIVSAPVFQSTVSYYQRHAIEDAQGFASVHYAIDLLSEKHREIITLRLIEGYDEKAVSERLGLSIAEYQKLYIEVRKELAKNKEIVAKNTVKKPIKLTVAKF